MSLVFFPLRHSNDGMNTVLAFIPIIFFISYLFMVFMMKNVIENYERLKKVSFVANVVSYVLVLFCIIFVFHSGWYKRFEYLEPNVKDYPEIVFNNLRSKEHKISSENMQKLLGAFSKKHKKEILEKDLVYSKSDKSYMFLLKSKLSRKPKIHNPLVWSMKNGEMKLHKGKHPLLCQKSLIGKMTCRHAKNGFVFLPLEKGKNTYKDTKNPYIAKYLDHFFMIDLSEDCYSDKGCRVGSVARCENQLRSIYSYPNIICYHSNNKSKVLCDIKP